MPKEFEIIEDEFPQLLANAIITLHQLPISYASLERIIAEAMEEEAMYRFSDVVATDKSDKRLLNLIQGWCQKLSILTGKPFTLEHLKIEKHEK